MAATSNNPEDPTHASKEEDTLTKTQIIKVEEIAKEIKMFLISIINKVVSEAEAVGEVEGEAVENIPKTNKTNQEITNKINRKTLLNSFVDFSKQTNVTKAQNATGSMATIRI